jgi:hypothetical protein
MMLLLLNILLFDFITHYLWVAKRINRYGTVTKCLYHGTGHGLMVCWVTDVSIDLFCAAGNVKIGLFVNYHIYIYILFNDLFFK